MKAFLIVISISVGLAAVTLGLAWVMKKFLDTFWGGEGGKD